MHVRRQKSVPFAQFDCKPKTTLQNEAHLTKKENQASTVDRPTAWVYLSGTE